MKPGKPVIDYETCPTLASLQSHSVSFPLLYLKYMMGLGGWGELALSSLVRLHGSYPFFHGLLAF